VNARLPYSGVLSVVCFGLFIQSTVSEPMHPLASARVINVVSGKATSKYSTTMWLTSH
jgi:hypothetical protein